MSEPLYRVERSHESGETVYRLVGPGIRSDAKPSEEYRQKLEELATLLNHARAVWEQERSLLIARSQEEPTRPEDAADPKV